MIEFTYTGTLDGRDVSGKVADGRITGNPFVAIAVQSLVDNSAHVGLGPWAGLATLDDEILARATVAAAIDDPSFDPPVKLAPLPADVVS